MLGLFSETMIYATCLRCLSTVCGGVSESLLALSLMYYLECELKYGLRKRGTESKALLRFVRATSGNSVFDKRERKFDKTTLILLAFV